MGGLIYIIAVLAVAAPQVQVSTVDGGVTNGDLQRLSSEHITLKTDSGATTLPVDQVLALVPQSPPATPAEKPIAWIEFIDGSKLTVTAFAVHDGFVDLSFGSGRTAEGSTDTIHKVRFSPPNEPSAVWPANVGADATSDLLVVRKKDQIDFMEGSLGNVDDRFVVLKAEGEKYPVNRSKVDGLVYYHKTSDKFPNPLCVVETTAGWHLNVKELSFVEPSGPFPYGRFEVTTLSGDKLLSIAGDEITKLDFSAGKIAYLSDLEPTSMQWTPYLDFGSAAPAMAEFYAPRRDEGREHQPLRLGGMKYDKGLSLYSRTAIDFRVPAGMTKFKALAGIDDAVRETGNVRLSISADEKVLFDKAVIGKDSPVNLDLDLAGAKRLSILVDYGDGFDAGDYLDLVEARMLK
jgi:hypothetical protein